MNDKFLQEVNEIINSSRQQQYGDMDDTLSRCVKAFNKLTQRKNSDKTKKYIRKSFAFIKRYIFITKKDRLNKIEKRFLNLADKQALTTKDAYIFMILLKLSRECKNPKHDSRVDIAGYVAGLDKFHEKKNHEKRLCDDS